ncbi:MAG: hypothetical protein IIZ63_05125 [Caulobacteraceae bacterium]|nr:hypothetical protein [Caulobacteraceae bacterium]
MGDRNAAHWLIAAGALVALAGCGRREAADWRQAQATAPGAQAAAEGYAPPPRVVSILALPSGGVGLTGAAAPDAVVRLRSPDGTILEAHANADGVWNLDAPGAGSVRLFGLSQTVGDSVTQGEGYLAVLPPPVVGGMGTALLLRSGAGAQPFGEAQAAPRIVAVDVDSGGGAVVSGLAGASAPLHVVLDGAKAGEGTADAKGRFSITLSASVAPGGHVVTVQTGGQGAEARAEIAVSPPQPLTAGPYAGQRRDGGWRIDWMTPGGGVQTTYAADAPTREGIE